ncbi:MAG: exo-alpha-sialidase [Ruminococcaceae bacterium]|nr:exo-alpha-sialidase [Oscillospiraceae bacterium]
MVKRIVCFLLLLSLLPAVFSVATAGEEESIVQEKKTTVNVKNIWNGSSDDGKYPRHRIPGIVVTKKDTVIIYCEARTGDTTYSLYDKNDWCMMDIYIQRSEDGGETFGEPIYIAYGTREHACVNNPVIMVGEDNTLHMLYCRSYALNGGDIWYRKSTDDGKTWTPERNLAEFVSSTPHKRIAFGPTHGICTKDGVLMTTVWMTEPAHAYLFYSEDNGETWKVSEPCGANTNESNVVQLSDGSFLVNSRSTPYRKVTTSPNGINSWSTTRIDPQLPDPSCCAGMVTVDLPGLPYAHLFTNCATTEGRTNITLKCSFDDCNTFSKEVVIRQGDGGYSDVAVDSRGTVYVLFEINWGHRVNLARLNFYDTFCADEAEVMTSTQTRFDLRGEQALPLVKSVRNGSLAATEEGLCLTANGAGERKIELDLSSVTKNLNLSDFGAVTVRVRSASSSEAPLSVRAEFRCGRNLASSDGSFAHAQVLGSEEQVLVFDLQSLQKNQGMLRSLLLRLGGADQGSAGDTVVVSELAFFETMEEATAYANPDEESPETAYEQPTHEGCSSAIFKAESAWLLFLPPMLLCRRKKQKKTV